MKHPTIPFNSFSFQNAQIRNELLPILQEAFDSGWYILGERLKTFEKEFSTYSNVQHTVGVANGLDAIKIALKSLGIKEGDEVLVPANTYIASILGITEMGAVPVLVEPELTSYNIDPSKIKDKITSKTKAILPVHLYGLPCAMDEIMKLANDHGLYVIEDNAQAVGASYKGKKTGSFGNINATSFYPTKNLGAIGDGGAITTNDEHLRKQACLYRNYGSEIKYYNEVEGYNSRLDELQAAVLSCKLRYLDQWNNQRIELANYYTKGLNQLKQLITPSHTNDSVHTYHLYVVRVQHREKLIEHLTKDGIQTAIHYPIPPYRQVAYKRLHLNREEFPVTELITEECLSLPLYPGLTTEEQDQVLNSIARFYKAF